MYDVTYRDRGAYLPFADALVVADLHVGRAEASNVAFPLGEGSDLRDRLDGLLAAFDPATVVFAGDVLHRFDAATARAASALNDLAGVCRAAGARPVLVRGNHDTALATAWDGDAHDEYVLDDGAGGGEDGDESEVGDRDGSADPDADGGPSHAESTATPDPPTATPDPSTATPDPSAATPARTVVCHGHAEPEADAALYVVGHLHPTIAIEGRRRPCYLYGESAYRGGDVLVLPAFTRLAPGVDVDGMRSDARSPLVPDADAFRPVVYDEDAGEALSFPPLGRFRGML